MQESSLGNVRKNDVKIIKNDVKIFKKYFEMDAQVIQNASNRRRRGARLDLLVFYSVFKRPQSSGGMRCRALITYWLGRLTKQ